MAFINPKSYFLNWPYLLNHANILIKFCINMILIRCSPKGLPNTICQRSRLCRGLKFWNLNVKWPYLLNRVEYFYENLHIHWYWQDLSQGIAKCHLSLIEALPRCTFWKVNWPYLFNHAECFDKIWHTCRCWQVLAQGIVIWHLSSVKALPRSLFLL